ncbi:MAG: RING finger protein [Candidatus Thorarchaeota archaeon]
MTPKQYQSLESHLEEFMRANVSPKEYHDYSSLKKKNERLEWVIVGCALSIIGWYILWIAAIYWLVVHPSWEREKKKIWRKAYATTKENIETFSEEEQLFIEFLELRLHNSEYRRSADRRTSASYCYVAILVIPLWGALILFLIIIFSGLFVLIPYYHYNDKVKKLEKDLKSKFIREKKLEWEALLNDLPPGTRLECKRCRYIWKPRFSRVPAHCPSCRLGLRKYVRGSRFSVLINEIKVAEPPIPYERTPDMKTIDLRPKIVLAGTKEICKICRKEIQTDLFQCPACSSSFHEDHLAEWVKVNQSCPVCRVSLQLR